MYIFTLDVLCFILFLSLKEKKLISTVSVDKLFYSGKIFAQKLKLIYFVVYFEQEHASAFLRQAACCRVAIKIHYYYVGEYVTTCDNDHAEIHET